MSNKPHGYWKNIDNILILSRKYKTRNDFRVNDNKAYSQAALRGILDIVCSHMDFKHWTYDDCKIEALKYNTRSEFRFNAKSAYSKANHMGWVNGLCSHMILGRKPNNYWDKERCHKEALKYTRRTIFKYGSCVAYNKASEMGWIDEICSHMSFLKRHPRKYWDKERCQIIAKKYNYKMDFINNDTYVYAKASKKGWLDDICSHMVVLRKRKTIE